MSHFPSEVSIDSRAPASIDAAIEQSPPWLVSTVVHLALLIVLALWSIGLPPESGFELVLSPEYAGDAQELDLGEPVTFDISADGPLAHALVEEQTLEAPSVDLTSLSLGDLVAADGGEGTSRLVGGMGTDLGVRAGTGVTSVFGLSGEGTRFVYVFDRSDSMNSGYRVYGEDGAVRQVNPLTLAKQELLHSLDRLNERHEFQIVFYNHEPRLFGDGYYGQHKLFPATKENKRLASYFVEGIPGEGNTNHWAALQAALPLRPDVIFLITDGEAKDDPPLHRVQSLAKLCRRRHIKINVLHFSYRDRPYCTLIPLAEETEGQHLFMNLESFVEAMN